MQKLITAFLICFLPALTNAHSYWIETTGSHKVNEPVTVQLFFGEYASKEIMKGRSLDKMKDISMFVAFPGRTKQVLTMTQTDSCWIGIFLPSAEGSYEITGINDVREVQDWTKHNLGIVRPVQYLKHIYQAGAATGDISAAAFLDIKFTKTGDSGFSVQVFRNGLTFPAAMVVFTEPDGNDVVVNTDENGKAIFNASAKGLHLVAIEWIDKTLGSFKGKEYSTVRHRLDHSFYN